MLITLIFLTLGALGILVFTQWLAVRVKSNKYLLSLAFYNSVEFIGLIIFCYLITVHKDLSNITIIILILFMILRLISISLLIFYSWRVEKHDTIRKNGRMGR
jgi:hypothetical protein